MCGCTQSPPGLLELMRLRNRAQSSVVARRHQRSRNSALVLATALGLTPIQIPAAEPPSLIGALSLGYDSNPAQRRDGPALGFVQAAVAVLQPLPHGLSLEGDGWLRDFAGHNDNGRLDLSGAWSHTIGKTQLDIWGSGGWYRDQLVRADERNETALGVTVNRALSSRFDVAVMGERRWFAYRHRVLPWTGRPGGASQTGGCSQRTGYAGSDMGQGGHSGQGSGGHGSGCAISARRRADRLDLLASEITWLANPRLSLTLGLDQAWRQSSLPLETRDQRGLRLALDFDPNARLGLSAQLGWSRLDYLAAPRQRERIDQQRWAGVGLQYRQGVAVIFCALDLLDSRSTIKLEAFTQWVGTCGYQYVF